MAFLVTPPAKPFPHSLIGRSFPVRSSCRNCSTILSYRNLPPVACSYSTSLVDSCFFLSHAANFNRGFCGIRLWVLQKFKLLNQVRKHGQGMKYKELEVRAKDQSPDSLETSLSSSSTEAIYEEVSKSASVDETILANTHAESIKEVSSSISQVSPCSVIPENPANSLGSRSAALQMDSLKNSQSTRVPSLSIAVIGATGELARSKVFPALFALYYSGFLPENVGIFGYSRKDMTDDDLRSMIIGNLTCRVDQQQNCGAKLDAFLSRTFYLDGGYDNKEGMTKLNSRMVQIEDEYEANRIFYLSVPQEALLDVATSLADNAQTHRGWTRIIIEKPFGFDMLSSSHLTQSLQSKYEEKQIYRIDHLLGKDLIENLTVLRFSNLVFEPLWCRTYIRNVQVIISEECGVGTKGRYFDGYGIIRDIVHSHVFQTIALFAMEPPVSLSGEDIRNEKVKVLRSIRKLELDDVVLGQYKSSTTEKSNVYFDSFTPTFFAAALYIDNPRWDGVPFLVKAGMGLIKNRGEIRIQFHNVPGNLYHERVGHNVDLATNELILRDAPDEAILVKVNNKVPGLGLQLDASELNLLYKDKYNIEVPDSYEHLLLDVIDGDNHLFMRSDEVDAAWKVLNPVLGEIEKNKVAPELYEFGGRGPTGAYYLGAKHNVRWADD
ncbi:inactive glucose-6-phosphate 1-dehydrogenase 4, chloroplastic [Aristolochia californica]|uniref:inactive glucose-6-phosphate 1-dehydrogenase 4, chloroplastic n=1 Tax=Aristolochia californica TaxID=171875 RepID=UPI0035DB74CA